MASQAQTPPRATSRQLALIRDLNTRTGTDFTYPGTVEHARQEIERLTALASVRTSRSRASLSSSRTPVCHGPTRFTRDGTAMRFVWNDRKVIVLIDLDDDPTDPADAGAVLAA